jgi:tetratricopeptide (TPR) repeat protein
MDMKKVLSALIVLVCLAACNRDPNVAKVKYVENGNKYYEKGKYKEALIMYRNALKRDMKYGEAYYRAALTELQLKRWNDAARDLHRAVELQPQNLDAHTRLANLFLNVYLADQRRPQNLLNELRSISDKMSQRFPDTYDDTRLKGYIALFDKNPKSALENFSKANQLKPLQSDLILVYMQTLAGNGQVAEAEKLGLETIQKQPSALSIYDAMFVHYARTGRGAEAQRILEQKVANNPKVADGYLQLAAHHLTQKNREPMMATLAKLTSDKENFPKGAGLVGDFFLRIREYDLAMQRYQEGVKQSAKDEDKHIYQKRMVEVLAKQNKKDEAKQLVQEILKEDPKDPEAIAMRASLSMLAGSKEELQSAITDLQSVVTRMPQNVVVRYNLGRALLANQNPDAARVQFEEAAKLRPEYLPPRIALAELLLRRNEFAKVAQMTQEILAYDRQNAPARLIRSRALIGMRDYKTAREELRVTTERFPNLGEARLQVAALDLQDRNFKDAEAVFRKLYSQSQDPRALIGLAETLVVQKQTDQALKLLKDELAKQPDRLEFRVALGNISGSTGDYQTAASEYSKVLEKSPRATDVWMRLAEAQRRMGDLTAAAASYKKAQELAPNNVVPYVRLAILYDTMGRQPEAKPLYEQALRLQPDHPEALNNLAFMLAESGSDLDQALTMAQRAKQALPSDNNVADTLGWIYIKKNLADSALDIFKDLVQKDPARPLYRYHLAMALYQKGDHVQAKKECELALKSKPPKDEETKIRDLLAKVS